jgi:hypothetical protein
MAVAMRVLGLIMLAVAGAVLAPAGATSKSGVDWPALHRPLHLPRLAQGQGCPVSRPARAITGEKFGVSGAIGPGPVYPVLPSASLDVSYRPQEWGRGPWAGQKVFWLVHPRYRGPVLIRGRRLEGSAWMRFDGGPRPATEIRIKPGETTKWTGQAAGSRGRPSYVRVRAAGCYAAQLDGITFSKVVIFIVSGPFALNG